MLRNKSKYKKSMFGMIPDTWDEKKIGKFAKTSSGGTPKRDNKEFYEGGTINWFKTGELGTKFIYNSEERITEKALKGSSAKLFPKETLLVAMYGATIGKMSILKKESATNQACCAILPNENYSTEYLYYQLSFLKNKLINRGAGGAQPNISQDIIQTFPVPLPNKNEQQQIASILSTWDKAIELKEKLIEQKKEQKKGLMQKLLTGKIRLPGFDGKWVKKGFEEIFTKLSVKKHQIKTNEYLEFGEYPVVDQGQKKIVAYSNDKDKVLKVPDNALIVFGDHTREIKFIDFDFVVGADGTQVLNTREGYDLKFYYYHLLVQKIPNNGYSRHFKFLKEMIFFKPSFKEQKAISNLLSTFDDELDLLSSELKLLKQQKKGLMQLLLTGKVRVKV